MLCFSLTWPELPHYVWDRSSWKSNRHFCKKEYSILGGGDFVWGLRYPRVMVNVCSLPLRMAYG